MKSPRIVYHHHGQWVMRVEASRQWHDTRRLTIGKVKTRGIGRGGRAEFVKRRGSIAQW